MDLSSTTGKEGDVIYIPQHPAGRDKSIGINDSNTASGFCEVKSLSSTDLLYTCDTEGGSSGSPVLDKATNKVIGIHKGGWPNGCHGNVGTRMEVIYPMVSQHVYGSGNAAPSGASSGGGCTDDANFIDTYETKCADYKKDYCPDTTSYDPSTNKKATDACCVCK